MRRPYLASALGVLALMLGVAVSTTRRGSMTCMYSPSPVPSGAPPLARAGLSTDSISLASVAAFFVAVVVLCLLGARRAGMARRAAAAAPGAFVARREGGASNVYAVLAFVIVGGVAVVAMFLPYKGFRIMGVLLWFGGAGVVFALGFRAKAMCREAATIAANAIATLTKGTRRSQWAVGFTCEGRFASLSLAAPEYVRVQVQPGSYPYPPVPRPGGATVRFELRAPSRSRVEVESAGAIGLRLGRRALARDPSIDSRLLVYAQDPEHAKRVLTADVQRELLSLVTASAMCFDGREVVFHKQVLSGPVWRPYFPSAREILDYCEQCARVADLVERALSGE